MTTLYIFISHFHLYQYVYNMYYSYILLMHIIHICTLKTLYNVKNITTLKNVQINLIFHHHREYIRYYKVYILGTTFFSLSHSWTFNNNNNNRYNLKLHIIKIKINDIHNHKKRPSILHTLYMYTKTVPWRSGCCCRSFHFTNNLQLLL